MLIIIDARVPEGAKSKLRRYGGLMELETMGITYPAISGHPDIFFTPTEKLLVVAPDVPAKYLRILDQHKICWQHGNRPVGPEYPGSAIYNAAVAENLIVHNLNITDKEILNQLPGAKNIHVAQGYTRCNLVILNKSMAITSDRGIQKKLIAEGIEVLYADPSQIRLPGFSHGFFGGTCGTGDAYLFIFGNLDSIPQGREIREFTARAGLTTVELCNTPLFDGGSIFCLNR
ncbi:MAG: DUF6873 family GME fold protein [Bacteroidota bacterium]